MILLAKLVDAQTALAIGLVSEILPDMETLHARAEGLAKMLAGHAPITMQTTKEALPEARLKLYDDSGRNAKVLVKQLT